MIEMGSPPPYLTSKRCMICELKFPISVTRCSECGNKLRTKPRAKSKYK